MTPDQKKWLKWLADHGGSGVIGRHGHMLAGGEESPQGAQICWLKLVAAGLVSGADGRLFVTEDGKKALNGDLA